MAPAGFEALPLRGYSLQRVDRRFIRRIELKQPVTPQDQAIYPWRLPALAALEAGIVLNPQVTFLVGENGSGKSTLLEAVAVAAGLNPEGGTSNFAFHTRESHSAAWTRIRLVRGTRQPRTDFFLRAESLFTAASYLDELHAADETALRAYGDRSLHEQSHGESFLAVMLNRFGADGLYFLDEPEAALSAQNCLTCLRRIHELVTQGSQFLIATHSPILLAYPGATIYECSDTGVEPIAFDDAPSVTLTRSFLSNPSRFLDLLLD